MSQAETHMPTIGDQIPYRRSRIQSRTGSLVFDRHLDAKLAEAPAQDRVTSAAPLKPAAVT